MNAVMDFPPLPVIDEPPEIVDEVIDAAPVSALVTLREHTMQPLSAVEQGIADLRAEHGSTNYDIQTPAGYRLATLRRAAVRKVRYEVPKIVKAKKAELAGLRDQVEEEGDRIVNLLREIEDPHDALIEAEDARKAAIKAEAARIEQEKAQQHAARLAMIGAYAEHCRQPSMTADRIAIGIGQLEIVPATDEDPARSVELADAQCRTLEVMRTLHAQAVAREVEAARQEQIRIENERQAEANRIERERIAAEAATIRKEAEALAAQRAESERLEALAAANRARLATPPAGLAELRAESTPAVDAEVVAMLDAMPGEVLTTTTAPAEIEAGLSEEPPTLVPNAIVPCMSLTALNDRLGFRVTEDFLAFLGIKNALPRQYAETQFSAIKAALITHLQGLK